MPKTKLKDEIVKALNKDMGKTNTKWDHWIYAEVITILFLFISLLLMAFSKMALCIIFLILSLFLLSYCISKTEKYKKKYRSLEKAKWIAEHWVKDNILNKDFFKKVYTEFDDDFDQGISILRNEYKVET